MFQNALFGEGIYLSSELSVSMAYSPTGAGWDKSVLGDRLSCFAVCQIIDDEKFVKCSSKGEIYIICVRLYPWFPILCSNLILNPWLS